MRAERILHRLQGDRGRRWATPDGDRWLGVSNPGWLNGEPAELAPLQGAWSEVPVVESGTIWAFAETYGSPEAPRTIDKPMVFLKPSGCVVDEATAVPVADLCARGATVWGEGELALLMGARGEPVGVTLANDVTMELPGWDHDHHLPFYKGQPAFCPVSSLLLPLSEADDHLLECWHDGELLRSGTSADLGRPVLELLDWLRGWTRLREGDLVLFGAPRRVGGRPRLYARPGTHYRARLNGRWTLDTTFG